MKLFAKKFAPSRHALLKRFSLKIATFVSVAGLASGSIAPSESGPGAIPARIWMLLSSSSGDGASDRVMGFGIHPV